ncbi:hypothetical protein MBLNU457_5040t1 [Dothideomycetes sp. NU457]
MDKLPPLGTNIGQIVGPTFGIYANLLKANASTIKSTKYEEFSYGPHDRQQLDVYYPSSPNKTNGRRPVLIFCYGGGLVRGNKTLKGLADDTAHANIGSFFAQKYGYTIIIPDYRLVGSHDAKFPSGGEDVALVLEWICKNGVGQGSEAIDLFLMGNSAGGVHQSTFLFHPSFASTREKVTGGSTVRLLGNILLSVPFDFKDTDPSRLDVLNTYYDDYNTECPLGLLESAAQQHSDSNFLPDMRLFTLNGELDPEDEIMQPRERFLTAWSKIENAELRDAMTEGMMKGHNHISPCVSLGTAIEKEEAWGHQVASFCEKSRK